ncbi:MAG: M67 family metallopeptidase [Sphingobium sp.]|nr:M67 family metallopeptidase [Sphingobium sp.]
MDLIISRAHLDAIAARARAESPHECCGLLLGDGAAGQVRDIRPAANVAAHPRHRFEIDPAVLLAAYKAARAGGPAVIGHYHSHPSGTAQPSETDAQMAETRGEYWLIVDGDGAIRAWRAEPGGTLHGCFSELRLKVVDKDSPSLSREG